MIDIKNLKQCQYNHYQMGLHEYDEDLLICQRYQVNIKSQQSYILDLYSTNYIIENQQIKFKRYFCLKYLKYEFDQYDINEFLLIFPLYVPKMKLFINQRDNIQNQMEILKIQVNHHILKCLQGKRKLIKTLLLNLVIYLKINMKIMKKLQYKRVNLMTKNKLPKEFLKRKSKKMIQYQYQNNINLTYIESSSSSVKIKKSNKIKKSTLFFNNNHNDPFNQQIFIQ
ncbi:unnamed protein product [Paramecium primaurelia]|uniref:Uncharacterized protein n=1 Tax=Paramecium primaurelia TaxID=5886 RepID=A0A8S1MG58_PARPR|nr:unnamed protein product [Paramecium primaurelia]